MKLSEYCNTDSLEKEALALLGGTTDDQVLRELNLERVALNLAGTLKFNRVLQSWHTGIYTDEALVELASALDDMPANKLFRDAEAFEELRQKIGDSAVFRLPKYLSHVYELLCEAAIETNEHFAALL